MSAPSHLRSFQAVEAAVRLGSLKAAAEELGVTAAAVGQRIKALEEYLGVDLVTRGRSGLGATPALATALPRLHAAFRDLQAASEALDLQRGHEIRVAADPDFADLWLGPRLAAFRAEHPNMRFSVNGEGDALPRLGAADCEIVFGPVGEASDREPLFADFVAPLGSPANVARLSGIAEKDRLEGFPLLHLDVYRDDPAVPDWPGWIARQGWRRTAPERGIRFRRVAGALDAVLADAGLTLAGLALSRRWLTEGRLAPAFDLSAGTWTSHVYGVRWRDRSMARAQMRWFRSWLLAQAAETRGWLSNTVSALSTKEKL